MKSAIKTLQIAKYFMNNLNKVNEALNKHDDFECKVIIIAMDGSRTVVVSLDNMEQYGDLFLIEAIFSSYWCSYILTFGDSDFGITSRFTFKRDNELEFSYPELFTIFSIKEFRDVDFSFVLEKRLIEQIMNRVAVFAERFTGIFIDGYKADWTIIKTLKKQKEEWTSLEQSRNRLIKVRKRLHRAVNAFINGDYERADKEYNEVSEWLISYELMRLDYIKGIISGEEVDYRKEPDYIQHNPLKLIKDMGKKSFVELLGFYIGWIPTSVVISVVFIAIYYGFLSLHNDAVFMLISGVDMCFVPALFIGFFAWLIPRKYFLKLILKDKFESYMAVDTFQNSRFYRSTLPIMSSIFVVVSIVFTILTLNWNIEFDKDRLLDNSSYFSIKPRIIMYTEIEALYREEKLRNGFNEIVSLPSYFIMLRSGEMVNLRTIMYDKEGFESKALTYLRDNIGIPLKTIDLIENIQSPK